MCASYGNRSGRGNVFLESAVPLARSLHRDIVSLGKRLEHAALAEESSRRLGTTAKTDAAHHAELLAIIRDIKALLARIEKDIPTLQLAISACGETFSSSLPTGISPSRLLQASFFLNLGDTQFASDPTRAVQIGPSFTLSLYMLFVGHAKTPSQHISVDEPVNPATPEQSQSGTPMRDQPYGFGEGERQPIWQEVLHKARVRLCRTPMGWHFDHNHGYVPQLDMSLGISQDSSSVDYMFGRPDEYSYHLEMIEDLDDGRVHEDDLKTSPFDDVFQAGIRESIPIHQIAKIFYTDSGRLLNIGNADEAGNNPILLLKRDTSAPTAADIAGDVVSRDSESPIKAIEDSSSITSDEQDEIDRQLREESELPEARTEVEKEHHPLALHLPSHLDPEWLALEVFADDDGSDSSESEDEVENHGEKERPVPTIKPPSRPTPTQRSSLDTKLLTQLKNLSTTDMTNPTGTSSPSRHVEKSQSQRDANFMARSPFSSVTSSLSLMEMLIRLTSLQEFQQVAHLSIPDYILSFFMEETSTTGLKGEERWKARSEAKRRVGFDPYTDTPTK